MREEVKVHGMRYFNIPVGYAVVLEYEVLAFTSIVEDEENFCPLFRSPFANRAGVMATLYHATRHIPPTQTYEENPTAGLKG